MGENYIMEEYKQKLPSIFRQILLVFKDAPTGNSWVSEKLMEVFCKDIAHNLELVKAVNFKSFLDGFLEPDGDVIMYPDFVMNNVSLMADEVLSTHHDCSFLEKSAFSIIRSPLQYWMVSRGHRVDVTFQIYKRWVQQRCLLHLLDAVQFDVSQALVYCLASPHNYTRQSAGDYFIELLKFSHSEPQDETDSDTLSNIKSMLKPAIYQLIQEFISKFIEHAESSQVDRLVPSEKLSDYNFPAAANYCRLISRCAATCDVFCRNCAQTEMFDELVALLKVLVCHNCVDTADLLRTSTLMLIRLIKNSDMQKLKVENLIKFLLRVCETENSPMMCDAVYMARLILTQCEVEAKDQTLLLELSLLPLFILFDVTPQAALSTCPAVITFTKSVLKVKQMSKPSSLLKVAVDNLSCLADVQISESCCNTFIDYLGLKRTDLPSEAGSPMLIEGNIRNDTFLNFLVLKLTNINQAFSKLTGEKCFLGSIPTGNLLSNIQSYTLACLKFPGISCGQLTAVLSCYLTILKYVKNAEQFKNNVNLETFAELGFCCDRQILQDILQRLQFKLFDMDPNVREMAVRITGELFFVVSPDSPALEETSVDMHACLSSLWQCVDNRTEGVAMNVLKFLLNAAEVGQLDKLLSLISVSKTNLITRIDTFLLSSEWDVIKSVAFRLLTKVSSMDLLVKYAEACIRQDNVLLSLTVLDYIQNLFSLDKSDISLEQKIDTVSSLFLQGWGDLILQKTNASDVCSFRKASSVIAMILCFLEQRDVCVVIDERVSNFCSKIGLGKENYGRSQAWFSQLCVNILHAYSCSETTSPKYKRQKVSNEHNVDTGNLELDDKKKTLNQRFDSSAKSSLLCSIFTLVDVEKVTSGERSLIQNRDMLENEQISGDGLPESAHDKVLSSDGYDFYLDSTKEMPALKLRTEPFTSQKLIQEILPCTDVCPDSSLTNAAGLLSWFAFEEIFRRIDPDSLQQEAQRSTDEYERNSVTLLDDLEQVLKRNYLSLKSQLEKELIVHLFGEFSCLLNTVLTEADFEKQEVLKEIVKFVQIIALLQHGEEDIVTFILQKRTLVLKAPFEGNENINVLDLFMERMNVFKVQGSKVYARELFASMDGLKTLLQLYMKDTKSHDSFQNSHSSTACVTNDVEVQDKSASTHKITDILHNVCSSLSKSDILECLSSLKPGELCFLNSVLDGELEEWETIQANLKTLLNSFSSQMFLPVLQVLQSLIKQLVFVVFEGTSQTSVERCSNISASFNQLQSWYVAEDCEFDSDGDDDPTAIDCY